MIRIKHKNIYVWKYRVQQKFKIYNFVFKKQIKENYGDNNVLQQFLEDSLIN